TTGRVIRASAYSDDAPPQSLISSQNGSDRHELFCSLDASRSDRSTSVGYSTVDSRKWDAAVRITARAHSTKKIIAASDRMVFSPFCAWLSCLSAENGHAAVGFQNLLLDAWSAIV